MNAGSSHAIQVVRHGLDKEAAECRDWVAREEPLEIRVRGRGIAVTMRTPGHDEELAAGFLASEGIVARSADILEIAPCLQGDHAGNIINVFLSPKVEFDVARLTRHVFASSSCGLCGKAAIESIQQEFPPIKSNARVTEAAVVSLPGRLRAEQKEFDTTGGLHAAGLFSPGGELLAAREDVGRHNAVDKVVGWALIQNLLPLSNHVLMVSGRASFEILQKALAAGVPIVASVSAPSSLAVEFARENGQTLIGFVRGSTFNVYAGAERIERQAGIGDAINRA